MPNYEKMYLTLLDSVEKTINMLINAQRECENIFIDTDDTVEITEVIEVTKETVAIKTEE